MADRIEKPEFTVMMKTRKSFICPECNGIGNKFKIWRNKKFIYECRKCGGKGRVFNTITQEVPFIEALKHYL